MPNFKFEDLVTLQKLNFRSNERNISRPRVSRRRVRFDLKRYLQGVGALHLLALQKERREPLLHTAVKEGRLDVVEVLIGRGVGPNVRGFDGWTPLHEAAARGYADILQVLLRYGADVSAETSLGETPYLLASLAGREDIMRMLLSAGSERCVDIENIESLCSSRCL